MDLLEVEFRAEDGGTFPMTWGQLDIWKPITRYGEASSYFNIPIVVDLEVANRAAVLHALRRLVERNQSLRAFFRNGADGPSQELARRGSFTVRMCESTPEASRARSEELAAELAVAPFDHAREWPVRFALVCTGEVVLHLVFVTSHVASDGGGVAAIIDEFGDLMAGPPESERRWQPTDEVRHERSKRGVRRNHAAIVYLRKRLDEIQPSMFTYPPGPSAEPRFQRLRLDSSAMAAATRRLAADCQVSRPSVVLTGIALALTTLTGQSTAVMQLIVSNRYDDKMRGMIAATAQNGLLVVPYPGGTVAEAIRSTHRAATVGFFYGYYNPADVDALINEVAGQRDVAFDLNAYFNDLTPLFSGSDDEGDPLPTGQEARELLADTVVVHEGAWDTQDSKFFLEADCGARMCRVHLLGDTAYLPLPTMEAVLRGVETLLLEAASREVTVAEVATLTGIKPSGVTQR